jgi:hypothetical protein
VNVLIEVAFDLVGRIVNAITRIIYDLGLNVVAVRAIWKDGIGVVNGGDLVVADTSWTVSVHPSAAVADIRRC